MTRPTVLVLTGAGVSAESGIPTFRAAGGLWESHPVEQVASPRRIRPGSRPRLALLLGAAAQGQRLRAQPRASRPRRRSRLAWATASCWPRRTWTGFTAAREASASWSCTATSSSPAAPTAPCLRSPTQRSTWAPSSRPARPVRPRAATSLLRPHIVWFGEMLDPGTPEARRALHGEREAARVPGRGNLGGGLARGGPRGRPRAPGAPRPGSSTPSPQRTRRSSSTSCRGRAASCSRPCSVRRDRLPRARRDSASRRGSPMLTERIGEAFTRPLDGLVRAFAHVSPNVLTIVGLALNGVACALFAFSGGKDYARARPLAPGRGW